MLGGAILENWGLIRLNQELGIAFPTTVSNPRSPSVIYRDLSAGLKATKYLNWIIFGDAGLGFRRIFSVGRE